MVKRHTTNFGDHEEKYTPNYENNNFDFGGDTGFKENLIQSKFNYDLFSEERALVVERTVRCRRIITSGKERWRLMENDKLIITLEGSRFSKKEKEFLRTVEGFNFLIQTFKKYDIKSVATIKKYLKQTLKG